MSDVKSLASRSIPLAMPFWSRALHTGEGYAGFLERFHRLLNPRTYLEVGVKSGATLQLASCASIGVDPSFQLNVNVIGAKPACHLYSMTSDVFFSQVDPAAILGAPIDMAFLDGLHWYEALLRDFINTEKHCKPNSVVFLHDCIPTDQHIARRDASDNTLRDQSAAPEWWAGDVWKAVAILLKYRPDLTITAFSAPPTGMVAITSLSPNSTILEDIYFDVVREFAEISIGDYADEYFSLLDIRDTKDYDSYSALSRLFWL